MFKLLSLVLLIDWAILFIWPSSLWAAEGTLGLSFVSTGQRGTVDVFRPKSDEKVKNFLVRFSFALPTFGNYWTVAGTLDRIKRDYSNFLLRDDKGEETPLSQTFDKEEHAGSWNVSYQKEKIHPEQSFFRPFLQELWRLTLFLCIGLSLLQKDSTQ